MPDSKFIEEEVVNFLKETRLTLKVLLIIHPSRSFRNKISIALKDRYWQRCRGDELRLEIINGAISALIYNYLQLKEQTDYHQWVVRCGQLANRLLTTMTVE